MRINTNVAALNSYNQLSNTQENMSQSLERLSSGKRINSAADDAAGLAISEKMTSQTRGLGQAQRNAQDGISMIQTAEGALKESHSILQRMRELSVQAANDTNTEGDRAEIQKEVDQLTSELDRIASDTEFNTQKLLNGAKSINGSMSTTTGTDINSLDMDTNQSLESGNYDVEVSNVSSSVAADFSDSGTDLSGGDISTTGGADAGNYQIEISDSSTTGATLALQDEDGNEIDSATFDGTTGSSTISVDDYNVTVDSSNTDGTASFNTEIKADMTIKDSDGSEVASGTGLEASGGEGLSETSEISVDSFGDFGVDTTLSSGTDTANLTNNGATLQIGANEDQNTTAAMNEMSAGALEVDNVDLTTQEGANKAIETIDSAIEDVSAERSKLGATQNRLEHTINNLNTSQENLTAAESRISDVDMAKEMKNMSKQRILKQAGTAMMAQANQMPQGVLKLLG